MSFQRFLLGLLLIALALPAWAEPAKKTSQTLPASTTSHSASSGFGWNGWGVRLGVASDADQVLGGAHVNLGEIANNLRFQPDVQVGAGDDVTTLYGTVPVYYRFERSSTMTLYAGGGPAIGYVDYDLPPGARGDDSEVETGAKATGGIEWRKRSANTFSLEVSLGFGDVHDFQFVGAWTF
jgi:opacity protein-like surface antigen